MSYKVKDPLSIEGQLEVLSGKYAYDYKIKDPQSIECQIKVLKGKDAYDNSSVSSGSSQDSQDSRTGLLGNVSPQPKAPQNKNLLWLVTVISLISIVLCAVVVTISLIALKLEVQHGIEESASKPPVVCIEFECIKIIKNPYDLSEADPLMDSLDKVFEDGVEKCCAHNNSQLSALIEMSMRLQRVNTAPLPDFNVSDFKFSPVSAHKRLYPPKNPFPEVNYRKRVPRFENSSVHVLFKYEKSMSDPLLEHEHGVEVLNEV